MIFENAQERFPHRSDGLICTAGPEEKVKKERGCVAAYAKIAKGPTPGNFAMSNARQGRRFIAAPARPPQQHKPARKERASPKRRSSHFFSTSHTLRKRTGSPPWSCK